MFKTIAMKAIIALFALAIGCVFIVLIPFIGAIYFINHLLKMKLEGNDDVMTDTHIYVSNDEVDWERGWW